MANCDCPVFKNPSIGADSQTYVNQCWANCLNVTVVSTGKCEKECFCSNNASPVCGLDGVTYTNVCYANCNNTIIKSLGPCPDIVSTAPRIKTLSRHRRRYLPPNACMASCSKKFPWPTRTSASKTSAGVPPTTARYTRRPQDFPKHLSGPLPQ